MRKYETNQCLAFSSQAAAWGALKVTRKLGRQWGTVSTIHIIKLCSKKNAKQTFLHWRDGNYTITCEFDCFNTVRWMLRRDFFKLVFNCQSCIVNLLWAKEMQRKQYTYTNYYGSGSDSLWVQHTRDQRNQGCSTLRIRSTMGAAASGSDAPRVQHPQDKSTTGAAPSGSDAPQVQPPQDQSTMGTAPSGSDAPRVQHPRDQTHHGCSIRGIRRTTGAASLGSDAP